MNESRVSSFGGWEVSPEGRDSNSKELFVCKTIFLLQIRADRKEHHKYSTNVLYCQGLEEKIPQEGDRHNLMAGCGRQAPAFIAGQAPATSAGQVLTLADNFWKAENF
jgi:hypothetical protein